MGLEDKLDQEIKEASEFRGEMRQYAKNTTAYIGAVSDNLKAHIDDHKQDSKEEKKAGREWVGIVAPLIIGVGTLCIELFMHKK